MRTSFEFKSIKLPCISEPTKVKKVTEGETPKAKKSTGEVTPKSSGKTTHGSSSKKKPSESDLSEKRKRVIQMVKEEVDLMISYLYLIGRKVIVFTN